MKTALPYILIAVSIGLFYLHIDPRYTEVRNLQTQKGEYVAAIEKAKQLEEQKNTILATYNNLPKADLSRLSRLLPEKLNTVKLVADMDGIAGKYGISISGVKVTEEAADRDQSISSGGTPQPYKTTVVFFKFKSSYDNMTAFLKNLEQSLQLIDIQSISFEVSDGKTPDSSSGLNDYQVSFQTYSLK